MGRAKAQRTTRRATPGRRATRPPQPRSRRSSGTSADVRGLRYGSNVLGKHTFRVRVQHVANHLAPLLTRRAVGAAKLDLVLRGVALLPQHAGSRSPGFVLRRYSWEQLHDLARTANTLGATEPDFDAPPEVVKLKRDWVRDQLVVLENLNLVRRELLPGSRSRLLVLQDDGSGEPLDDPTGTGGDLYITIRGDVIASGALARWGAQELSAYLAATVAERWDSTASTSNFAPGTGQWFRPLAWFADVDRRFGTDARTRIPFSVPTLERGLRKLRQEDLISWDRITHNPRTRARLRGPRNHYHNHFDRLGKAMESLDTEEYLAEAASDNDEVEGT